VEGVQRSEADILEPEVAGVLKERVPSSTKRLTMILGGGGGPKIWGIVTTLAVKAPFCNFGDIPRSEFTKLVTYFSRSLNMRGKG